MEILYTGTKAQWEALDWPEKEEWLHMVKFICPDNETEHRTGAEPLENGQPLPPVVEGVVIIPEGTVEIPRGAYLGNREVEKVILPDSLRRIGDLAFAYCPNLRDFNLPEVVEKLEYHVFKDSGNLHEIVYGGNREQFEEVEWIDKREYLESEPDEDFKEFMRWITFQK